MIEAAQLVAGLNAMDEAIARLQPLIALQHDRRQDVIPAGTVIRYSS